RIERLSAKGVVAKRHPGYYADGGGLYLQVSDSGTKSWVFRFTLHGKTRDMGLGSLNAIKLADARQRAEHCRKLLVDKIDPIAARDQQRRQQVLADAREKGIPTFKKCAEDYIKNKHHEWKNGKHAAQWSSTLETYAYPVIGELNVADID